jgi:hypothetical protein
MFELATAARPIGMIAKTSRRVAVALTISSGGSGESLGEHVGSAGYPHRAPAATERPLPGRAVPSISFTCISRTGRQSTLNALKEIRAEFGYFRAPIETKVHEDEYPGT